MKGVGARIGANLLWVLIFAAIVVVGSFLTFVSGVLFDDSYPITVPMPEWGGVLPDQVVTVLGRQVGLVEDLEVTQEGVDIELSIDGGKSVPREATVQVLRRSPIGEQAVDFQPENPDSWEPAEAGARIDPVQAIVPTEIPALLESTVDLFENIAVEDVSILFEEAALALDGRGGRLRMLTRDSLALQRTLVDGLPEFERLIDSSEEVLTELDEHKQDLADSFGNAADLATVFAEQEGNLNALLDSATPALNQTTAFIEENQANFSCLTDDLTALNRMLLGPSTYDEVYDNSPDDPGYDSKLDELENAFAINRFFFQDGFRIVGQADPGTGLTWLRVQFVADEPQTAQFYDQPRATPQTKPGAACESPFGLGVDAVRQPGVQPPHETAPEIAYAPLQRGGDGEQPAGNPEVDQEQGGRPEGQDEPSPEDLGLGAEEPAAGGDGEEDPLDLAVDNSDPGPEGGLGPAGILLLLGLPPLAAAGWYLSKKVRQ